VTFRKHYYPDPKGSDAGKIISANVYFSFFPLFKISDNSDYNDYFKIMMVDDESSFPNVALKIFDEHNIEIQDNTNAEKHHKRVVRNIKTEINNGGSYFYETNFAYKFLEITLSSGRSHQTNIKGLIVPLWKEISLGHRMYDVAIDFGTTNSHIVLLENRANDNTVPQALTIGELDQQTVLFNRYKNDSNLSLTEKYETWNSYLETRLISRQKHEFIPSIIGQGDNPTYRFPIRTAISTATNYNSSSSNLLGNINISFIFEKDVHRSDENIQTNLKWEITEGDNEIKIKEFIKELLLLVRNKILLNQGDPKHSRVLWFKPLSMYEGHQEYFRQIWDEALRQIFKPQKQNEQTQCLTESCAPFFYYAAQNKAQSTQPVLSIDIGGGSTDVSFFLDNEPKFGISFNFAGNAIWNPGLEKRHKTLEGIFIKYGRDFISEIIKNMAAADKDKIDHILKIFNSQQGPGIQSENIFNLYFTWDHVMHFTDALKRDPYIKFLIFLHFYSIIYFSLKLIKLANLKIPTSFYVNCKNQKYLPIIESFRSPENMNGFISELFKRILSSKRKSKIIFDLIDTKKEAITVGGFYYFDEMGLYDKKKKISKGESYLGEMKPEFKATTYSKIDNNLKESVSSNVKRFLEIFFAQDHKYNFTQKFIITLEEPLEKYKDYCIQNSLNFLELGLSKRLKNVKLTDQVNEPLFFYPIISMIYELSKKFYNDKD